MKKNTKMSQIKFFATSLAVAALAVTISPSPTFALTALIADLGTSINSDTTLYTNTSSGASNSGSGSVNTSGNLNSSVNGNVNTATNADMTAQSETYRSAVSRFINNVTSIANRQPEISAQVRTLVQAEDNSNSATVEAMADVESRGTLRTFLFGPAYRSLTYLRDQYEKRAERIQELRNIAASANAQVKADLNAQIDAFVESQAEMNAFIADHEDRFSLFGWLVRLFQ